ncbi:MAG: cbb3-type cytochrome c oxidase subunit 3 [Paracoccaceae bacterium]|nr:MAG: cbb3-type cytochrome c oxidase subunit 3 [Paracoccaceae bacterium]
METYTFLRQLADSWALLLMFTMFLGVVVWAFRPGSRARHDEAANQIFRNDARPARNDDKEAQR